MDDGTPRSFEDADAERVAEFGYQQELRREFGFFHAFAISFADTSLIVAFYGVFALALAAAGPSFFWGLLVVLGGQFLVALVLGEVASVYPLAGGIYQWTRQQTGQRAGWFAAWAYWWTMAFTMTSCAYAAASFLLPGLGVNTSSKSTYILVAAVIALVGLAINSIAQAILKLFVSLLLIAELTTTVGMAIAFFFFYRAHGFGTLLQSFNGSDGGFHWLWIGWLGAVAIMGWTFLGFDAAGSIAEEVHDPARNVPRAIVGVMMVIGVATVFVTMASILAIPNIRAAMTGGLADPVIQTATAHFGSAVEKPILVLISMGFVGSMVALHTAGSRILYSFGRDRMIPGGAFFQKLTPERKLPVNALVFTTLVSILILLINIGAEKVFTTLLTISVAGFFVSYAFPIMSQFVLQRRGTHRPGPFTLGAWSKPVTAIASVWIVLELINVWWPRYSDLPWYQNWGVLAVTILLTVLGFIAYAFAPRHDTTAEVPSVTIMQPVSTADEPPVVE
jgi:amino acid transporter